jgi:nucleotide-binding universal stress UspA family protein
MSGIVAGVDGSDEALRALEWAINEAGIRTAPLTVVAVHQVAADHWGLGELHYPQDESARNQVREAAQQAVDKAVAQFTGLKPASVHVKAASGVAAEVLIEESRDADMLVVGTRGGGFERAFLGSVSTKVGHHSACPVVIVPASKQH